jgi:type I restriction enzyme, S subunit
VEFLARFFQSQNYWDQISAASSGTAQPGVNATKLETLKLSLPPTNEQRRIVAKLDALQQRSNRVRADLQKLLGLGCVENHRELMTAATRWIIAVKL